MRRDIYAAWAPPGARWSGWVKPVLFATMEEPKQGARLDDDDLTALVSWAPPARVEEEASAPSGYRDKLETPPSRPGDTALVIELPGALSLRHALVLTTFGYRPVPVLASAADPHRPMVDVREMARLLARGAAHVRDAGLPDDAPPAFVLDAGRMMHGSPLPGAFDNRSLLFPSDFPSASMLASQGIRRVLVAREAGPGDDLAHVLLRYRDAGLSVQGVRPDEAVDTAEELTLHRPGLYRSMMYRAQALFGLRRNPAGGFGSRVPEATQGGAGG